MFGILIVCVFSIRVYVVYVGCAWCMLNMHYVQYVNSVYTLV